MIYYTLNQTYGINEIDDTYIIKWKWKIYLQIHLRQFEGTEYAASERKKL